jgi:hypothetical protein
MVSGVALIRKQAACDPLGGRPGFKDGGLTGPPLELNNRSNEDSRGPKRRKRTPRCTRLPTRAENMIFSLPLHDPFRARLARAASSVRSAMSIAETALP